MSKSSNNTSHEQSKYNNKYTSNTCCSLRGLAALRPNKTVPLLPRKPTTKQVLKMIIEIRPATGGQDAKLFAAQLTKALLNLLTRLGIAGQTATTSENLTTITLAKDCPKVRVIEGVHRIQRVPQNDTKRQTSTATVTVLDAATQSLNLQLKDADFTVYRKRGTGNGGQNRNKRETACQVVHNPSGLRANRSSGRSILDNIASAKEEIKIKLEARQQKAAASALNEARTATVKSGSRAEKSFTHNSQRGVVINHETGQIWRLVDFQKGRI